MKILVLKLALFSLLLCSCEMYHTTAQYQYQVPDTLSDGLASNNLNNVFLDSKGRMWVNPDVMTARQFRLSFFQFDGTKSIFHELKPDSLSIMSASQT